MKKNKALTELIKFLQLLEKRTVRLKQIIENKGNYHLNGDALYIDIDKGKFLTDHKLKIGRGYKEITIRSVCGMIEISLQKHNSTVFHFINILNLFEGISLSNDDKLRDVKISALKGGPDE